MTTSLACVAAVVAVAGISASMPLGQQSDTTINPLAGRPEAAVAGRQVYDRTCQSCHGPAGEGDRGPALNTGRFSRGNQDGDLFHVIRAGVNGTQMPPFASLSDEQTWQLVSYIRSLAAAPASARPSPPPPPSVVVTTKDGRELRGTRLNEDTFSLQIADTSGAIHLFDKSALRSYRVEGPSAAAPAPALPATGGVTVDRLVNAGAEPQNWLMYWGDYQATHYSRLTQIDAANVKHLRAAWTYPMAGESVLEATPVVVDGVMYVTQPGVVAALDARTGRELWRHARQQKVKNPYEINPFNRGVAVAGHRLIVGTLDAALVALDARTGQALWETQVADTMLGYSLTSAPLVVKDRVIVGITGGVFCARGLLDA
jgi:mono/diheme cytochrome c family protein